MAIQQAINQALTTAAIGAGAYKKFGTDAAALDLQQGRERQTLRQDYFDLSRSISEDQANIKALDATKKAAQDLDTQILFKLDRITRLKKRFSELGKNPGKDLIGYEYNEDYKSIKDKEVK